MDTERFEAWMRDRTSNPGTISSRVSTLKRVEDAYGDLDTHYQRDRFAQVLGELAYSPQSEGLRGNSRIRIDGNVYHGLATLRSAVTLYRKFRTDQHAAPAGPPPASAKGVAPHEETQVSMSITLSLDELAVQLSRHIDQQRGNLTFIEDDTLREPVQGRTVMHGQDATGALVAVELLTRRATRDDVARFVEGLGRDEEAKGADVRGVLVAMGFEPAALLLARKVQSLELIQYTLSCAFHAIEPTGAAIPPHARSAVPAQRN